MRSLLSDTVINRNRREEIKRRLSDDFTDSKKYSRNKADE